MYSKSVVVSFSYEFRVFVLKNFKSLFLLLDKSDTKTAHKRCLLGRRRQQRRRQNRSFNRALLTFVSEYISRRRLLFHLSYKISFRSACEERSYSHHFVSLFDGSNLIKNPSHGGSEEDVETIPKEQRERFADVFVSGASRWEIFFFLF